MPLTLADAKVGMADKIDQLVIDEFRRDSFILDKLTFDDAVSPGTGGSTMTYGYMRLKTPSTAEGRAINGEYKAGEAKKEKATTDLKIFGGAFEVDRVLEKTAANSEIQFQLKEKIKATKNKFHYDFINGKASKTSTDFDGIDKLVTGSSTERIPDTAIDLSTSEAISENAKDFVLLLDDWLTSFDEKPDALLVNSRMKTILCAVARELKYYSRSEDAFGRKIDNYDGIAIIDMGEYYNGTKNIKVIPVNETDGTTDIYAVKFGLDSVHAASPKGGKIIETYLPDLKAPGAVKKGEVEMIAGLVLKNTKRAGVYRKVKVNAPQAGE